DREHPRQRRHAEGKVADEPDDGPLVFLRHAPANPSSNRESSTLPGGWKRRMTCHPEHATPYLRRLDRGFRPAAGEYGRTTTGAAGAAGLEALAMTDIAAERIASRGAWGAEVRATLLLAW